MKRIVSFIDWLKVSLFVFMSFALLIDSTVLVYAFLISIIVLTGFILGIFYAFKSKGSKYRRLNIILSFFEVLSWGFIIWFFYQYKILNSAMLACLPFWLPRVFLWIHELEKLEKGSLEV